MTQDEKDPVMVEGRGSKKRSPRMQRPRCGKDPGGLGGPESREEGLEEDLEMKL